MKKTIKNQGNNKLQNIEKREKRKMASGQQQRRTRK